jgi:multidrug efflux pump
MRPKLARVRGVSLFLNPVQDLGAGGRQTNATYQYVLHADNPDLLKDVGDKLVKALKAQPAAITDVDIDQQDAGASAFVTVDRDAAARLGIAMNTIDNVLYDAFGQRQVAQIYQGLNQYHVVMEAAPIQRQARGAGQHLSARRGRSGRQLHQQPQCLTGLQRRQWQRDQHDGSQYAAARLGGALGLGQHQCLGQPYRRRTLGHGQLQPAPGVSLDQAAQTIAATQANLHFPATVHGDFGGTAKQFKQSMAATPLLILAAILTIYIVLGILYESAIHPLTVLSTLPSAGIGAVFSLIVMKQQFDLIALIGIILLIGIVKKNAILIIDFALDAERSRGVSPYDAIREACVLRFRPIMMTTLAAALGAVPLAIGFGDGAELRRPLGIAIVGGLIASQMLTLFTTPVVYLALDRWRRRSPYEKLLARHGDHSAPHDTTPLADPA